MHPVIIRAFAVGGAFANEASVVGVGCGVARAFTVGRQGRFGSDAVSYYSQNGGEGYEEYWRGGVVLPTLSLSVDGGGLDQML